MKVRNKRLLAVLAALVAISMIATGCGGSGERADDGATEAKVIKIGIGAPLTQGAVALGQGMKRGCCASPSRRPTSARTSWRSASASRPSTATTRATPRRALPWPTPSPLTPNLVGVMGHLNSGVSIPASAVYNENKIVQVSPASTNPALTQQGFANVFRVCATDDVQGPAAAEVAFNDFGFKSAVVIDDSTPYGEGLAAEFAKKFEELGGEVMFTEKTSDKDTDFNALVTKIKGDNSDLVYYGGIYNAGALLSKQMTDAGCRGRVHGRRRSLRRRVHQPCRRRRR